MTDRLRKLAELGDEDAQEALRRERRRVMDFRPHQRFMAVILEVARRISHTCLAEDYRLRMNLPMSAHQLESLERLDALPPARRDFVMYLARTSSLSLGDALQVEARRLLDQLPPPPDGLEHLRDELVNYVEEMIGPSRQPTPRNGPPRRRRTIRNAPRK